MKKTEKGSIKQLAIQILTIAIAGMILWPFFDLIVCKVFTHTEFVYSVSEHITEPIIFGCIIGTVFWALDKKGKKK